MNTLEQLLKSDQPIILDGAMGTTLMAAGLEHGDPPEEWNLTQPEKISQIHRDYIEAGSQIILTNSFGGTKFRLALHHLDDQVFEINRAAARIARLEADQADHTVLVAGSMGPTGQLFVPLGETTLAEAQEAFAAQAEGLAAGGVDLFWIETMSDLEEVKAAIAGIRQVSDLPISATMSFDTHGHTMMGVSPVQALQALQEEDISLVGANCGTGSTELLKAMQEMLAADPKLPLVAKANAGIPQVVEGQVVYNGTPELMAEYARQASSLGVKLIGGCCGSTPEHIRAMAAALQG